MGINEELSNQLIETISQGTDIQGLLVDILRNYNFTVSYKDKKITFEPKFIELYYSLDGNDEEKKDPYCDKDESKKSCHSLFFRSLKGKEWNRNRVDLCLGSDKCYVSLLIKRAVNENKVILTDKEIARVILDLKEGSEKFESKHSDSKFTYEFISRNPDIPEKGIGYGRRIHLVKGSDYLKLQENKPLKADFANKTLAAFDRNYCSVEECKKENPKSYRERIKDKDPSD